MASSWKNQPRVQAVTEILRNEGYEVDAFCDPSGGRLVFNWNALSKEEHEHLNTKSAMTHPVPIKAYREDRRWLDWADAVVLVLPAGNSAHLEAGYAAGRDKAVFVLAPWDGWHEGEFDVMYGLADYLCDSTEDLVRRLSNYHVESNPFRARQAIKRVEL
jgi:hypothetical protein